MNQGGFRPVGRFFRRHGRTRLVEDAGVVTLQPLIEPASELGAQIESFRAADVGGAGRVAEAAEVELEEWNRVAGVDERGGAFIRTEIITPSLSYARWSLQFGRVQVHGTPV